MASKYDIRRTSNAQGIPAMQKANTRGFDPKQFEPPTGEEDRDKEEREEEGGVINAIKAAFGGLIDLTQASRIGSQGYSPEDISQLTEEEKMAALKGSEEDQLAEGKMLLKSMNPVGSGAFGAISGEFEKEGYDPFTIPDIGGSTDGVMRLDIGSGSIPTHVIPEHIQKYGEKNLLKGINFVAEEGVKEFTNLSNYAIPLAGRSFKTAMEGWSAATNKWSIHYLSSAGRKIVKPTLKDAGELVDPMLTSESATYYQKLAKEMAMINMMIAGGTAAGEQVDKRTDNVILTTAATLGGAIATGKLTSKQVDELIFAFDPNRRKLLKEAIGKIVQTRRIDEGIRQMEQTDGVPVNVPLGPTVRPNLPSTPKITDPDFDPDIPTYRTTIEAPIKLDESAVRRDVLNDIREAEAVNGKGQIGPTGVVQEGGYDRLVNPRGLGKTFRESIEAVKSEHPKGWAVDVKEDEFYSNPDNLVFFDETQTAGAVVTPDGELVSVHKRYGSDADVNEILRQATDNAVTLDAFDVGGFLPSKYAEFGFKPVARIKFDTEYAPEGWRPEDGTPDVVFMVKDTNNVLDDVARVPVDYAPDGSIRFGYEQARESVPIVSTYDEALAIQSVAKARVLSETPLPQRPDVTQFDPKQSPLPVRDVSVKEFSDVTKPQALLAYDDEFNLPRLRESFDDLYRRAHILDNMNKADWTPEAAENQIALFSRGKYRTSDGQVRDWTDVPALPVGNQNNWLLQNEYQALIEQMNSQLSVDFGKLNAISVIKSIPFGSGMLGRPRMRSINSFLTDGRWNEEAIYREKTNPNGFIDFDWETGNYIWKGESGKAVLDVFRQYGDVVARQEALEAASGLDLRDIDPIMAKSLEDGQQPEEVINELRAAWDRGELPFFGDTIEASGVYGGMFPRQMTQFMESLATGSTGRRIQVTDDSLGTYRNTMAEVANSKRAEDGGDSWHYLGDPAKLVSIRLQAGMDALANDWMRRNISTPRAGLGGETLSERMRMRQSWATSQENYRGAREELRDSQKALDEIKRKALPRATREEQAAQRAQREIGIETERLDKFDVDLRNRYQGEANRLLQEVKSFKDEFLQVGRPLVKGARGTKQQPVLRLPTKTAIALSDQVKKVEELTTSDTVSASEIRDAIDELRFLYERGLTIFDNELKKRPALRRQIEALRTSPDGQPLEATSDAWENRRIRHESRQMDHDLEIIGSMQKNIADLRIRVARADPERVGELQRELEEAQQSLNESRMKVQAFKKYYNQQLDVARGVGQDILMRKEIVFDKNGIPLRGQPRMGPDGLVEGDVVTQDVPHLASNRGKVIKDFERTGVIVDAEFARAVENALARDALPDTGWGKIGAEVDNINNSIRAFQASYDLSGMGIQGLEPFGLSPLDMLSAQTTAYYTLLSPKAQLKFLQQNEAAIRRNIDEYSLHYASTNNLGEFVVRDKVGGIAIAGDVPLPFRTKVDPVTGSRNYAIDKTIPTPKSKPWKVITSPVSGKKIQISSPQEWERNYENKVAQTMNTLLYPFTKPLSKGLNVSNAAFTQGGNMMRHNIMMSLLATANVADAYGTKINFGKLRRAPYQGILKNPDDLTKEEKRKLGSTVNALTGWQERRPSTLERAFMFAPRFFGAQLEVLETAALDAGPAGSLAKRAMRGVALTAALYTWWANKQNGHPTDFNPTIFVKGPTGAGTAIKNPNFLKLISDDSRKYSLLGKYDSTLGLLLNTTGELGDPLGAATNFLRTKGSPLSSKAITAGTRKKFSGEEWVYTGDVAADSRTTLAMLGYLFGEDMLPFGIQGEIESQRVLNGEVDPLSVINKHLFFGALGGKESPLSANARVLIEARRRNPDADYKNIAEVPSLLRKEIGESNPAMYEYQTALERAAADAVTDTNLVRKGAITNAKATLYAKEEEIMRDVIAGLYSRTDLPSLINSATAAYATTLEGIDNRTLTTELDIENLTPVLATVRRISNTWDKATVRGIVDHSFRNQLLENIRAANPKLYEQAESIMERVTENHPAIIQETLKAKDYLYKETRYYATSDDIFKALFNDNVGLGELIMGTTLGSQDRRSNEEKAAAFREDLKGIAGGDIDSMHEFQVLIRTTSDAANKELYQKINNAVNELADTSRIVQKMSDPRLDLSAIVYLGAKPVMHPAAQQAYPNGWPLEYTVADAADEIRALAYHPESAEKYIELLTMTQVLNERGMQPQEIAAGITDFEFGGR